MVTAAWQADLRRTVRGEPLPLLLAGSERTRMRPMYTLQFIDNETVVATCVTRAPMGGGGPKLSRRGGETDPPMWLWAVFFDAVSGGVKNVVKWPSGSRSAGVVAVHGGELVVQSGRELTLYSSGLRPLGSLSLPLAGRSGEVEAMWGGWIAHPSPSGREILFVRDTWDGGPWILVGTDPLRLAGTWRWARTGPVSTDGASVAMVQCPFGERCRPVVEVGRFSGGWSAIALSGGEFGTPQFFADGILVVSGAPDVLINIVSGAEAAIGSPGTYRGAYHAHRDEQDCGAAYSSAAAVTSAGGRRFVIPACRAEGSHPALDIDGHWVLKGLYVFDLPSARPAYVLKIAGPKVQDYMFFALSPDGRRLAVLDWPHLEVFDLPPISGVN